jgi:hypothetical protein
MKDHKAANNTDFEKVNKNIEEEETTRLGNIKYVVDQVNDTNKAMDTEYTGKLDILQKNDTGFGKLIAAETAAGVNIDIKDVTDTSKLKLMKDVSVIGSMSIRDLQNSTTASKRFKACGIGSSASCIEFPDSNGDTYLTGLTGPTSSVVSGSLLKAKAGLKTDTINNNTNGSLTIQTKDADNTNVNNKIEVGNTLAGGITLTSGTSSVEIKDGAINITTSALGNIKFNGKAITEKTITEATTGITVLALEAAPART